MMKKRIIAVLVVIALLVTMFPMTALAAAGTYTKTESTGKTKMISGKSVTVKSATLYNDGYRDEAGGTVSVSHKTSYLSWDSYWDYSASAKDGYVFNGWTTGSGSGYSVNGNDLRISYSGNKTYTATANFEFVGYTVTINLGNGGKFTSNNSNTITLTGVPRGTLSVPAHTIYDGYDRVSWSNSLDITSSRTINAEYEYRVNFEGNTGVTVTGGTPVWTSGHTAPEPSYTVADEPRWRFDGWDRSLSGITAPTTITANPAVERGYIDLGITGQGHFVHPDRARGWYDITDPVRLNKSVPLPDFGWLFTGWFNNNTGEKLPKDHVATVTGDCTYTAIFESLGSRYVNAYVSGGNGRLANNISGTYAQGTSIDLNTADPVPTASGYEFKRWEEYIESSSSWKTVSENGAGEAWITVGVVNEYRAIFGLKTYTVDTTVTGGSITPDQTVTHGDDCTITYSPSANHHIVSVTVDGSSVNTGTYGSSYTFSGVTDDHAISVVYAIDTYDITTSATNGTITPDQTVGHGSDCTITYSADTGYHLDSITVDGTALTDLTGYETSYTFSGVTGHHTIDVVFAINIYDITTSVTNGTITPDQTVTHGDDCTITYSADTGYHLASVTVDGTALPGLTGYETSYTFSGVADDHTIDVVFAINMYDITTSVTNGTITTDQSVAHGSDCTITYSADTGYHLDSITVDGTALPGLTGYETSYTFSNVTGDHAIDVVFAVNMYDITTSVTNGTITPDQSVAHGDDCTITYSADTGYHLDSITVDGTALPDLTGYETSYTFSGVTGDHTIDVVFAINMYDITTSATNGTITPDQSVTYGDDCTITYSANSGYHLDSITVDGTALPDLTGYETSYTFSGVTGDHTIDVVFAINTYDITTSVTNGTITPDQMVNHGDDCTITYSADTGYHLDSITVDGTALPDLTGYETSYTFSGVTGDHAIDVVFAINTYDITTSVKGGTITPDQIVDYGSDCTIYYTPASSGYHLIRVTVDGTDVDISTYPGSYTFTDVTDDHTIDVEYEYRFKVKPNSKIDNGVIKVTYAGEVRYVAPGSSTTFVAVDGEDLVWFQGEPDTGYEFDRWHGSNNAGYVADNGLRSRNIYDSTKFGPYVHFKPIVYSIGYDLDGGSVVGTNPATYTIESGDITLINPTKDGYNFTGWNGTDIADGTMSVVIPAGSIGDRSFTATWSNPIVYDLAYDYAGGSVATDNPATYTVESGDITLINPTRDGYNFTGWNGTDITDGTMSVVIPTGSIGDRSFTATWSDPIVYNLTYDYAGGSVATDNPATYTVESGDITLINPTRDGYNFTGWNGTDIADGTMSVVIPTGSIGDRSFTATWSDPIVYNLTYDYAGGSVATDNPVTYTIESDDITLINPTRTGYTFTGWEGTDVVAGTDIVVIATGSIGDRSFTAQWAINTYTVTFQDYDGTELGTDVVAYGGDAVAPDDPLREGYNFTGWDEDLENVTRSFTTMATYAIKTFTVKFVDHDDTVLKEQTVDWGKAATAPDDPEWDDHEFDGWDKTFDSVKSDLIVKATYKEIAEVEPEPVPATKDTTDTAELEEEPVPKGASSAFPWWWIPIVGAAALALFLILFFWKRRKKDEEAA